MSILGIRKKTKQGAWMYDTIDSSDFSKYKAKGWRYQKSDMKLIAKHVPLRDLSTKFTRVFDNSPLPGTNIAKGFKFKLKSDPFGNLGFFSRKEAEKMFKNMVK